MVRTGVVLAASLASALTLSSCLSYSWSREEAMVPVAEDNLASLQSGASLEECLDELGAPLYLWEYRETGIVLAWGSSSRADHGFSLSVPLSDNSSVSINFNNIDQKIEGVVLVFDEALELRWIRRGYLSEIAAESGLQSIDVAE